MVEGLSLFGAPFLPVVLFPIEFASEISRLYKHSDP